MAEIVLAAIGVVPALVEVIKAYRKIRSCVKTARKCTHHLNDICLSLDTQRALFLNQCALLLRRCGEDETNGQSMIHDAKHPRWTDATLEERVQQSLGNDMELCRDIISRIREIQDNIFEDLELFKQLRNQKQEEETMKSAFQRRYRSFQFVIYKTRLEDQISQLRDRNNDLQVLRTQMNELEQLSPQLRRRRTFKQIPKAFLEVQQISSEACGALQSSFHCTDESHDIHSASLCLDVEETVQLKVAITYETTCGRSMNDPPLWLLLKPKPSDEAPQNQNHNEHTPRASTVHAMDSKNKQKAAQVEEAHRPANAKKSKKRKVMFADLVDACSGRDKRVTSSDPQKSECILGPTLDLRHIVNACHYLRKRCSECLGSEQIHAQCIAFFRQEETARYIFYITTSQIVRDSSVSSEHERKSLRDHIQLENERNVTFCHRLMLAMKLVRAVLQFHGSPWLSEEWNLTQLQLLSSQATTAGNLTLYLNSRLSGRALVSDVEALPDAISSNDDVAMNRSTSPLSQAQHRGIDNITLFCLGIALIEIGHWSPLYKLRNDYDHDEIDTARRIARGTTMLGPWYDAAIQKCLRCDFAFGSDLKSESLQRAIYNDVFCRLEDLVTKLNDLCISA